MSGTYLSLRSHILLKQLRFQRIRKVATFLHIGVQLAKGTAEPVREWQRFNNRLWPVCLRAKQVSARAVMSEGP